METDKETEPKKGLFSGIFSRAAGKETGRRDFLKLVSVLAGTLFTSSYLKFSGSKGMRFLRPPGALANSEFLRKCMRCGICGQVCPNQCIQFFSMGSGENSETPFILPRLQGCMLCMKCNNSCPSGALQPLKDDMASIIGGVKMGKAVVDRNICYSYNNRSCGICYRACPLQDEAIKVSIWERPEINKEKCVGCGLCERVCIHYPQAIKVIPS